MISRDKSNLKTFSKVMEESYKKAKKQGLIPNSDVDHYNKLMATGPVYTGEHTGWMPLQTHRVWRRRVARMYWRQQGRPLRALVDWAIAWDEIVTWIMENIVPVMRLLVTILPFIV